MYIVSVEAQMYFAPPLPGEKAEDVRYLNLCFDQTEGRAEANRLYSFDIDGSRLSPGVYLIRLSMAQNAETFKMIITE